MDARDLARRAAAAYEGRVNWSGELGFGVRPPEEHTELPEGSTERPEGPDGAARLMEAVIFFVCAAAALVGAVGVIISRNPVHSALWLLLTMLTMAVFFLMQDADLVAIIQIVVYASAIVVLFLFVITLLGVDQHESLDEPSRFQRPLALALGVLLLAQVDRDRGQRLGHRRPLVDRRRSKGPAPATCSRSRRACSPTTSGRSRSPRCCS